MPIRQGGILANRASTWLRDHFCRSTIVPRSSRPTTWNEFLPISMPITESRPIIDSPVADSHQNDGITVQRQQQPTSATKSAQLGHDASTMPWLLPVA